MDNDAKACKELIEALWQDGQTVKEYRWYAQNEDHPELNDELAVAAYQLGADYYWLSQCNDGLAVAKLTGAPTKTEEPNKLSYPSPADEQSDCQLCAETFGVEFVPGTYQHNLWG